ncbi:hypothetical protein H1V43_34005 [Streptomyces sp. PSKA54]|uniref:Integral membrane protein n=1 Tax=Streptomyces himalayensis subsp. aureolus TaxID=2758039 RepID=A0A7W2HJW6_9ACTN|nr:hypothetical protein [Streptomyces himalayensis]MBA4866249.1 hypothetical protein [Streptomyces himalayensis subsp. aureolus]
MAYGVLLALCAAVLMGVATVLQALGARRETAGGPVRAMFQWPFLVGVGVDALGFVAEVVALRSVPLFLVEAALASSLAVTAAVAAAVLRVRLRSAEWGAVVAVCCGLAVLAVAAGHEGTSDGDARLRWVTLGTSVGLILLGWVVNRRVHRARAAVLGGIAGLSFGLTGIGVRLLPDDITVTGVPAAPTAYAVVVSGLGGYLLLIEALRSGSVTAATGAMVIGETVWPGVFGVVWLGDTTRPGFAPLGVAGFVVSVAGALALARFGEAEQTPLPTGGAGPRQEE